MFPGLLQLQLDAVHIVFQGNKCDRSSALINGSIRFDLFFLFYYCFFFF